MCPERYILRRNGWISAEQSEPIDERFVQHSRIGRDDFVIFNGWRFRSRTSHRHWRDKQTGRHRSSVATSWSVRPRNLILVAERRRAIRDFEMPHFEMDAKTTGRRNLAMGREGNEQLLGRRFTRDV